MEKIGTYAALGIPDAIAVALVLISLSLSLAPWFGGAEIGPLKVPHLSAAVNRWFRVIAPAGFVLLVFGFFPIWQPSGREARTPTYQEYVTSFFDNSRREYLRGSLFGLNELEVRELRRLFGSSTWDGGPHWGKVSFDESGRSATYTNEPGRSPGRILIQGAPEGTVPVIIGEWHQQDAQKGRLRFGVDGRDITALDVAWGPGFAAKSLWKRLP